MKITSEIYEQPLRITSFTLKPYWPSKTLQILNSPERM